MTHHCLPYMQGHSHLLPRHQTSQLFPQHLRPPVSPLQKLLFSATMTQNPEHLALLHFNRPKLFTITDAIQLRGADSSEMTFAFPEHLVERRIRCKLKHKPLVLLDLIRGCGHGRGTDEMQKVLCFINSKDSTHR